MQLDPEWLATVFDGNYTKGRTTALLVAAAQMADFEPGVINIVAIEDLKERLIEIAKQLDFNPVAIDNMIRIKNMYFVFNRTIGCVTTLYDHSVWDFTLVDVDKYPYMWVNNGDH
jgi:hypothetical protein